MAERPHSGDARSRGGATEFVSSTEIELAQLVELVRRACTGQVTSDRETELRRRFPGGSDSAVRTRRRIDALALLAVPVLVLGEEGTPRTEVVRALHELGASADHELVEFDAGVFREELMPPPPHRDKMKIITAPRRHRDARWSGRVSRESGAEGGMPR